MYYTYKKYLALFLLFVLGTFFFIYMVAEKFSATLENQQYYKIRCDTFLPDFYFDEAYSYIYKEISEIPFDLKKVPETVANQTGALAPYYLQNEGRNFLIYFIPPQLQHQIYFLATDTSVDTRDTQIGDMERETCQHQKSSFLITSLEKKLLQQERGSFPIFIDGDCFYVRRDQSYICNQELKNQSTRFQCHPESYYIALSEKL